MEENGKYLRLFGTILFSVIGFILALILVFLCLRLFFGLLSYVPWTTYIFILFIISVPATLFISIYLIYFFRTRSHPSKGARWFSYILFAAFFAAWGYFYISDLVIFFKYHYTAISYYMSYDMIFLISNIVCLFLLGMVQALAMKKEPDWLERRKRTDDR